MKRAIVDIDNTLWHFCDAFYDELRKINQRFPTPDHWTHWDIWEGYCTEGEFYHAVNAVHLKQHHDQYVPYPEARDFLLTLRENGFHITIASHRSPDYLRQTEIWLGKHGLVHDEVHLSHDKTVLFDRSCDVVIDDSPYVLENAAERGIMAAGLRFPWNRQHASNGYTLHENLNAILRHILICSK